jgi:kinesin family protein 26
MLRVSDSPPATAEGEKSASHLSIDKKKRQVTLCEQSATTPGASAAQDRAPMVSAPKMFAFDALHTSDDSQVIKIAWNFLLLLLLPFTPPHCLFPV